MLFRSTSAEPIVNLDALTYAGNLANLAALQGDARHTFVKGDIGYHHIHTVPTDPRKLNPEIPPKLASIVLKCMEKDKENRYQSTDEIFEDIKEIL